MSVWCMYHQSFNSECFRVEKTNLSVHRPLNVNQAGHRAAQKDYINHEDVTIISSQEHFIITKISTLVVSAADHILSSVWSNDSHVHSSFDVVRPILV